jgi:hypothetical protein
VDDEGEASGSLSDLRRRADLGGRLLVGGNSHGISDPLDSTTNFAHGLPIFADSIALERAGEMVLGMVYDRWGGDVRGRGRRGSYPQPYNTRVCRVAAS